MENSDSRAIVDRLREEIIARYQPIGCGTRIGVPGRETTCAEKGGICMACFERRNRRDEALALVEKAARL